MRKIEWAGPENLNYIVDSQIKMALETEKLELSLDVVKKGVQAVFDDPSKGKYLLCLEDDKVCGVLIVINEWSDWRNGNVLWIHSVFVDKEYRGAGVFKSMYEFLKNKVENDELLAGLRLYVDKTNQDAISVYKKIGMSRDHYYMFEWLK
ncbi:MAG: ribosomal protein S18 acetylase RimI-like enzyme [Bacteriovoracaceae bacterium]|jgi:ribosomal protein S18 acetylase RimI-like enzyme